MESTENLPHSSSKSHANCLRPAALVNINYLSNCMTSVSHHWRSEVRQTDDKNVISRGRNNVIALKPLEASIISLGWEINAASTVYSRLSWFGRHLTGLSVFRLTAYAFPIRLIVNLAFMRRMRMLRFSFFSMSKELFQVHQPWQLTAERLRVAFIASQIFSLEVLHLALESPKSRVHDLP